MKFVVVMPFDPAFDEVYRTIKLSVQAARPADDVICLRVDEDVRAGHIAGKIVDHIHSADICIADITQYNPNVMWEVGFIEALRKPLIAISQSIITLPFNIRDLAVIPYLPSQLETSLQHRLTESIRQTIASLGGQRTNLTVAVTGSRNAGSHKAKSAVQMYASPFLSPDTTWYLGTNGIVDEEAARFLLDASQHVVGIHAEGHPVSRTVGAIFAQHSAPLLDVDKEPLPRRIPELTQRDAFLVIRADLLILIWDRKSKITGLLHMWLTDNGKDHLLAFI